MDETPKYESLLLKQIAATLRRIKALYGALIDRITITADAIVYRGVPFRLSDYPLIKNLINSETKQLQKGILIEITDSINAAWDLSNKKNDGLVDRRLGKKRPTKKAREILYDPNREALREFLKRKEKGLNLSKRVWRTVRPFAGDIEKALAVGISEGKPAASIARDLKAFLNQPDKLFRRVRDAEGELQLSRAAKNYHPGRGVYRSSFKNAMRLAINETNTAYRSSDFERWQKMGFVTGIEVKLSNSHPTYDLCDEVQGKYPRDFKFTGWHVHCLCFAVPLLASDKDYSKIEDVILGISDEVPEIKVVDSIPDGAKRWLEKNSDRINNWKSKPHFITNNPEYLSKYLQK